MKYRTDDGWIVEVVRLAGTGRRRGPADPWPGTQLRVSQHGYLVAYVRTVAELRRYLDPADLRADDGLSAGPWHLARRLRLLAGRAGQDGRARW